MARLYHPVFRLELFRASFRPETKLQGLYLTLSGEGFGLGHRGEDNRVILAMYTNCQPRLNKTLAHWQPTETKVLRVVKKRKLTPIPSTSRRS
jgi:hypothetical protein